MSATIDTDQYVNAQYKIYKNESNATLKQRGDKGAIMAINIGQSLKTRFGYNLNALDDCLCNQKACVDLVFDGES